MSIGIYEKKKKKKTSFLQTLYMKSTIAVQFCQSLFHKSNFPTRLNIPSSQQYYTLRAFRFENDMKITQITMKKSDQLGCNRSVYLPNKWLVFLSLIFRIIIALYGRVSSLYSLVISVNIKTKHNSNPQSQFHIVILCLSRRSKSRAPSQKF